MTTQQSAPTIPEVGRAVIVHRPFGPQCLFGCPRGKGTCGVEVRPTPGEGPGNPRWDKFGPDDRPTLSPSVNCGSCGWHGYVVDGKCTDAPPGASVLHVCAVCEHPEIFTFTLGFNARGQAAVSIGRVDTGAAP